MHFYEVTYASDLANNSVLSNTTEPGDIVLLVISIFVLVSGVLSILFILWGGLLMILSGGKEDKITPALNTIRYAILGIIITVVTIFIFPILGGHLGLDVSKYAEPSRIFAKIEELGNKVFGRKTTVIPNTNDVDTLPNDFLDL